MVGVPDPRFGSHVAAVVAEDGVVLDPDAVRTASREHLTGYKVPRQVFVLEELPRSFFAQPDPLKWIAGAANCLRIVPAAPQLGQSR